MAFDVGNNYSLNEERISEAEEKEKEIVASVRKKRLRASLSFLTFSLILMAIATLLYEAENIIRSAGDAGSIAKEMSLIVLLLAIFSLSIAVSTAKSSKELEILGGGRYEFWTVLECPNCGFTLEREFRNGEAVGMHGENCPKCGKAMKVKFIYGKPERELEEVILLPQL